MLVSNAFPVFSRYIKAFENLKMPTVAFSRHLRLRDDQVAGNRDCVGYS